MRKYKQLSLEEREKIYIYRNEEKSLRFIAKQLGRSVASISREIGRNCSELGYLPDRANLRAKTHRYKNNKKINKCPATKQYIIDRLVLDKWPPEVISAKLKESKELLSLSHETVYQFIYSREGNKMQLYEGLMYGRRKRLMLHSRIKRPVVPTELRIEQRPERINAREEVGHFEGDLTFFKGSMSANVMTMLERVSRGWLSSPEMIIRNPCQL